MEKGNDHDLFSRKEAAKYLGVGLNTLDSLDIPETRIRNRVMYKRAVLNKWIDENTGKKKRKGKTKDEQNKS